MTNGKIYFMKGYCKQQSTCTSSEPYILGYEGLEEFELKAHYGMCSNIPMQNVASLYKTEWGPMKSISSRSLAKVDAIPLGSYIREQK